MAYARIDEGFWTDPLVRSLSLEGKMIAAWLFTNPHRHFSGIYYLPKVLITVEIGVSIGVCTKELNTLEEKGFSKYSEDYSVVWVIQMLKHQAGLNSPGGRLSPQQVKGIEKQLGTLHGCPLITEFIEHYQRFKITFDTPINTPIDIKSQSKSQSQEKDIAPPGVPPAPAFLFYSCQFFEVDFEDRMKYAKEFPALTDDILREEFSKMEDWIKDNKSTKKYKANGHLANPRSFIKSWLKKVKVDGAQLFGGSKEPKGFAALREARERRERDVK